ncbi:hypothetical protein HF883_01115 [Cloacibacillus porcorum]|uniref:trimethylamine methyltransferase family protein n=1 Tax=Cloacibacillus porcorum TaxID=1197717 RepID=UPI001459873B|nr:trimethylamine methyltransferase family protein [Cloacibacillus porcorum]MCC8184842.1 trimethylamine methyltransferase family protein [Cloacibacillus porcorum]MDY5390304.1 trimethylamine methyltransferase family protein [Cloacibacillus porcorum]NMF16827.1 hypothetical protein [Cloacibacillus porcorum]
MTFENKLQKIHDASMGLLAKSGIRYPSPTALDIFKKHGADVEGDIVRIDESTLIKYIGKAPARFTIEARNPKYNVDMGGGGHYAVPAYGSPYVEDFTGETRYSTLKDFIYFLKQIEALDDFHINGGILCQPNEYEAGIVTLLMWYAILRGSEKVLFCPAGNEKETRTMMEMACNLFGGRDEFSRSAKTVYLVDSVSPLQMDARTVDVIRVLAEYRQPFSFTSGVITGLTGPVTLAGAIAVGNAEILSGIALAQMIEEGTPAIYGIPVSGADMRTSRAVFGAPEMCIGIRYAAKLAKFYGLPSRGPAAISDAAYPSQQCAFESMMTMSACFNEGLDFLLHTAGCQDSFNSISPQKFAVDVELFRRMNYLDRDIAVDEDSLAVALTMETGHGGNYLTCDHTLANFKKSLYIPQIGLRYSSDFDNEFDAQITKFLKKNVKKYAVPNMEAHDISGLRSTAAASGLPEEFMDAVERLLEERFETI